MFHTARRCPHPQERIGVTGDEMGGRDGGDAAPHMTSPVTEAAMPIDTPW